MNDFSQKYAALQDILLRDMEKLFADDVDIPHPLKESMAYSLLSGGKNMRGVLLLSCYEMFTGHLYRALPYACAIEMVHSYSLIHDDLPCMDADDMRRGKPTNHKVFGEAAALLAGDGLLSYAMEVMVEHMWDDPDCSACAHAACQYITHGAGVFGMVAGQCADLEAHKREATAQEVNYIHSHKTGALIQAAACAGAALAGAKQEEMDAVAAFSEELGMVFQIVDDILDVEGDAQLMGKNVGMDDKMQKMTYPRVFGLEQSKQMAKEHSAIAKQALEPLGDRAWFLRALVDRMHMRKA